MSREQARILVIDDDEVVLTAIADLLEDAGFKVYSQTSPIGATNVIANECIDLAIIDINLPVMQGDNVVRLLRAWDRLKDLPIIVLSGQSEQRLKQIQDELRTVRSLTKATMRLQLVLLVEQLLKGRPPSAAPRASAAQRPAGGKDGARESDFRSKFINQVSTQLSGASVSFREMRAGSRDQRASLLRSVSMLRGQAHLLGLDQASRLLGALHMLVESMTPGDPCPLAVEHTVTDAVSALLGLKRSATGEFLLSPEPLITGLTQAMWSIKSPKL